MVGPDRLLRDWAFEPTADVLGRALGLDCFSLARWLLCANAATTSIFAVSRIVTRASGPARDVAGPCILAVSTVAAMSLYSAAMSVVRGTFPNRASSVDDHLMRDHTALAFLVALACWISPLAVTYLFLPSAPANEVPFDVAAAVGCMLVGFAVMFSTCKWRRHTPTQADGRHPGRSGTSR